MTCKFNCSDRWNIIHEEHEPRRSQKQKRNTERTDYTHMHFLWRTVFKNSILFWRNAIPRIVFGLIQESYSLTAECYSQNEILLERLRYDRSADGKQITSDMHFHYAILSTSWRLCHPVPRDSAYREFFHLTKNRLILQEHTLHTNNRQNWHARKLVELQ